MKPNPETDSEDSESDGPDEPVIPSPEMDDVKGEIFLINQLRKKRDATSDDIKPPLMRNWKVLIIFLALFGYISDTVTQ